MARYDWHFDIISPSVRSASSSSLASLSSDTLTLVPAGVASASLVGGRRFVVWAGVASGSCFVNELLMAGGATLLVGIKMSGWRSLGDDDDAASGPGAGVKLILFGDFSRVGAFGFSLRTAHAMEPLGSSRELSCLVAAFASARHDLKGTNQWNRTLHKVAQAMLT